MVVRSDSVLPTKRSHHASQQSGYPCVWNLRPNTLPHFSQNSVSLVCIMAAWSPMVRWSRWLIRGSLSMSESHIDNNIQRYGKMLYLDYGRIIFFITFSRYGWEQIVESWIKRFRLSVHCMSVHMFPGKLGIQSKLGFNMKPFDTCVDTSTENRQFH